MSRSPRRKFDDAFKREAVELVLSGGRTLADVARSLEISANLLGRWKKEYQSNGLTDEARSKREDLAAVKRELARVTQERNILKKALGIFSRIEK